MSQPSSSSCPHCGRAASPGDFLCPGCEAIVSADPVLASPQPPPEPSLVQGLLAPPQASLTRRIAYPPPPPPAEEALGDEDDEQTRAYGFRRGEDLPKVIAGLDLDARPLSSFEAFVVSFIDGRTSVAGLARKTRRPLIELQAVLETLIGRGVVRMLDDDDEEKTVPGVPEFARPRETTNTQPGRMLGTTRPRQESISRRIAPAGPTSADGALQKAIALERSGRLEEAIQVLEGAIAVARAPGPLFNKLALVLIQERRDFAGARLLLEKALALEPDNRIYRENLAQVRAMATTLSARISSRGSR